MYLSIMRPLPLDQPVFEKVRKGGFLYVDKTREIYRILEDKGTYYFLSRPRRFGKSLLISTLESLFLGKKELFEGLYIYDKIDWKTWGEYPVIRINFSEIYNAAGKLEESIIDYLNIEYGSIYGLDIKATNIKTYVHQLFSTLYRKTGRGVVLLIDEYDKPITDYIGDFPTAFSNRDVLRDFYDAVKNLHRYLHFVFLTGISKYSRMSVFSVLNNLRDLSEKPHFNNILGFTEQEIRENLGTYVSKLSIKEEKTEAEILYALKHWYDGYSWSGEDKIYNPFSIINVCYDLKFSNYWYGTGTPKTLVDYITMHTQYQPIDIKAQLEDEEMQEVTDEFFKSSEIEDLTIKNLLFQTGYLTIKSIRKEGFRSLYTLDYPNHEVKWSFSAYLLHLFSRLPLNYVHPNAIHLRAALRLGDVKQAITLIRSFFERIPHELRKNTDESYYHSLIQILLTLIGIHMESERSAAKGRMDGCLIFSDKIYVIEFKYANQGTMDTLLNRAMSQIKQKNYMGAFTASEKSIFCLAIGFLEKKGKKKEVSELVIDYLLEQQ